MSNQAICDALFADLPKLQMRAKMLTPKLAKRFKKEKKFPAWKWEEYTHQESKNRFLICFCAPSAEMADDPVIKYLTFLEENRERIIVHWGSWMYRENRSIEMIATRYVGYYRSHFFSRYRDRYWKGEEMSQNELLCRYFTRNTKTVPLEMNEDIQRNYLEYGEFSGYAFQVHDGTCFGQYWNEGDWTSIGKEGCDFVSVVMYRTFVNNAMMPANQFSAIEKEGNRYLKEIYSELYTDVMKEELFRRLSERRKVHLGNVKN